MRRSHHLPDIKDRIKLRHLADSIKHLSSLINCDTMDDELRVQMVLSVKKEKKKYVEIMYGATPHMWYRESRKRWCVKYKKNGSWVTMEGPDEETLWEKLYSYYSSEDSTLMSTLFNGWISMRMESKNNPLSDKTASEYARYWDKYYQPIAGKLLSQITDTDWRDFFEDMINANGFTKSKFSDVLAVANGMMKYAISKRYICNSPIAGIQYNDFDFVPETKSKKVKKECFTDAESQKVAEWCMNIINQHDHREIYALLMLFQITMGMRIGECRGLNWEDVDFNNSCLYVGRQRVNGLKFDLKTRKRTYFNDEEIGHLKGHEDIRKLFLSDSILAILKRAKELSDSEAVFHIRYNTYNDYVKKAAEYAGCGNKTFSTHCLRVTGITSLYDHCGNIDTVQAYAGHTTSVMTNKYIKSHKIEQDLRDAMLNNSYSPMLTQT